MAEKWRLDKVLAHLGLGTRREVKALVKAGRVAVNGVVARQPELHIDIESAEIQVDDKPQIFEKYLYLMLHKPAGYISATEDKRSPTVLELLPEELSRPGLFPVGRLDKDTEGFLIITDDGDFAHAQTAPSRKVPKTYFAKVTGELTENDVQAFAEGMTLSDGAVFAGAKLSVLESGEDSTCEVVLKEGQYHQVKRMFEAVGKKVTYLKRIKIGRLELDESLPAGQVRRLSKEETDKLLRAD